MTMRALRTRQFIAAGSTLDIVDSPRTATSNTPGIYESAGHPLRRGHAYRAIVYTPRPTAREMRPRRPTTPSSCRASTARSGLQVSGPGAAPTVVFPWWTRADAALVGSAAGRARTARRVAVRARVRARATSERRHPDAVRVRPRDRALPRARIQLQREPAAQPRPARRLPAARQARLLPAVLGRDGAALAHGRRAGARRKRLLARQPRPERREYVVRDVDAHSWVEVYMPGIGWVTRDPTPPDSPARTQLADLAGGGEDGP